MLEQSPPLHGQKNLRPNCLSAPEVLAQSVALIGPSLGPAMLLGAVYAVAGNGTWLAELLAMLVLALAVYNVNQFTRRSTCSGSLYTFIGRGLGPGWGLIGGWVLLISYTFGCTLLPPLFAHYLEILIHPWFPTLGSGFILGAMIVMIVAVWYCAYRDIQISTRVLLYTELGSIVSVLFLAVLFFAKSGRWADWHQLKLTGVTSLSMRDALTLAIYTYAGFEGAAALGAEAKNPLRSVPRAITGSLFCVGAYFVVFSYTLVAAFRDHTPSLDKSDTPLADLAAMAHVPFLGYLIAIGVCVTNVACLLACLNAASRILFTMARHGILPSRFGHVHPTNETPHRALAWFTGFFSLLVFLLFWKGVALLDIADYAGTVATLGYMLCYVLVSLAAPVYLRRRREKAGLSTLVGVLVVAFLAFPIFSNFYPLPESGVHRYLPFLFLALLGVGLGWLLMLRWKSRETLEQMAAELDAG